MILNFVLANSFYGLMPETIWKGAPEKYSQLFMTGKSQFSILFINTWLSIFTIAGLVLVVVDIVKKKQNK
ncbi:hypothetical protein KGY73_10615 [bacterium]|nr:hypothetical protein [bacterium]